MPRANKISFTGKFSSRDEAGASLKMSGDTALVHRGVARMLLMNCPCGCGDVLVINLDSRAGPAWRIYRRGEAISLYPSYWRDTKCESHFILWRNIIYWCDTRHRIPWWCNDDTCSNWRSLVLPTNNWSPRLGSIGIETACDFRFGNW